METTALKAPVATTADEQTLAGPASTNGLSAEAQAGLRAVDILARLDFSAESLQRATLRRKTLKWRRALSYSCAGAALTMTLMLALLNPGGIAAAVQNVYGAIKSIVLGDYNRAVQNAPAAGGDPSELPPDVWKIRAEIGNFAGNAPPGVEPIVRSVTTLEEAQAIANFHLMAPTDRPAGYALREVKLAPIAGTYWMLSFYSGGDHDVVIVQMPIGRQPSQNPNELIGIFSGFVTDATLEEVEGDVSVARPCPRSGATTPRE